MQRTKNTRVSFATAAVTEIRQRKVHTNAQRPIYRTAILPEVTKVEKFFLLKIKLA